MQRIPQHCEPGPQGRKREKSVREREGERERERERERGRERERERGGDACPLTLFFLQMISCIISLVNSVTFLNAVMSDKCVSVGIWVCVCVFVLRGGYRSVSVSL